MKAVKEQVYPYTTVAAVFNCVTLQTEGEVQTLTKRVRQLEEDFEQTETRLHTANEKFAEASKAADESERSALHMTHCLVAVW